MCSVNLAGSVIKLRAPEPTGLLSRNTVPVTSERERGACVCRGLFLWSVSQRFRRDLFAASDKV